MRDLKDRLQTVIFGTETKVGKLFDVVLLWAILFSMLVVMLESVGSIQSSYSEFFNVVEWFFTILFSVEYLIRVWVSKRSIKYVFSFWGVIDLFSFLPSLLGPLLVGMHYLVVIRTLRLLRVFRILKLTRFITESQKLVEAMKGSFRKIVIFFGFVTIVVIVMGTLMYVVEGESKGFKSIPESIYWAVVTVTTVGYGDITPQTVLGKFISSVSMLLGYAIIAIPTGIVTVEMSKSENKYNLMCSRCNSLINKDDVYCRVCGEKISNIK